jgi:outer membrane usher protein
MDFDSAWNWHSLVLEGSASYLESFDHPLQRHDMRLVYDSPKDLVRYSAGDLLYPLVGYQTTVNMGGVSVSRDFSLQPYINAYPVSQFEFYLDTPATVDVWVNETLTSTLHLNPGTHDIRDFPFSTGQNDVKIVITDIYGRVQELRFSFIQETSLLAPGLSQFSYNGGFLRTIKDSSYRYESDEPVVSLFYRKGMSDVYTLGGYMQCLKDQGLAGFEGLYAIPMGTLQFDTAVSAVKEADWGMASKLTFTHRPYTVRYSTDVSWQLGIEFLGQGFSRITNPCPEHNASLNLSSYVNFPIGYGFSSGIGAGYAFRWDHRPNKYNLSGSITRTWFSNLNSNLTLQYKRDEIRDREVDAFFGLVWMFPVKNQSVSLSMASKGNLNLQWDYNQTTSVPERVYASASTNRSSCENKYEAKMGYIGNRGIVEVSQRLIDPHGYDDHALNNQTDVTLQSALVYVDGNWALSRPVSQGFVLVKGVKNLNDSVIAVNPNGDDGYQAISSRYGPAVLPSLSPYNVKKVEVQPMDPPAGYLLENSKFILFPTYKSGYALYVGSDSMVVIIGSIVDGTSGQPFGHQIIEIISLDDKKAKPFQTFTNRKGQFQLLGLKPGNYEIRVDESTGLGAITFELHEGTEGIYRIGTLALPKKP